MGYGMVSNLNIAGESNQQHVLSVTVLKNDTSLFSDVTPFWLHDIICTAHLNC